MAEVRMVHKNRNWSHFGDPLSCMVWSLCHGDSMHGNRKMKFCIECSRFVENKQFANHEHRQDAAIQQQLRSESRLQFMFSNGRWPTDQELDANGK